MKIHCHASYHKECLGQPNSINQIVYEKCFLLKMLSNKERKVKERKNQLFWLQSSHVIIKSIPGQARLLIDATYRNLPYKTNAISKEKVSL